MLDCCCWCCSCSESDDPVRHEHGQNQLCERGTISKDCGQCSVDKRFDLIECRKLNDEKTGIAANNHIRFDDDE